MPTQTETWRRDQRMRDPWRARWVRRGGVVVADWKSVYVRIGTTFAPRWFVVASIHALNDAIEALRPCIADYDATRAILREAWTMHRQLRALRLAATSARLREVAALAGAGL